uniref:Uncharacterized protein n=1 Tax=Pleurostomum flabellatum TaxID=405751 RepID=A0A7T0Q550_9EUKA|nr:hypothetical protein J6731_mgp02 [Pleurostomum flabellatum]QPL15640.1 hypothetical protein [Pleurostomum flabellatum]
MAKKKYKRVFIGYLGMQSYNTHEYDDNKLTEFIGFEQPVFWCC